MNSNLSTIAFEQIHAQYYRGKYGDFEVIIDKNTGYINATKLCVDASKDLGIEKRFRHWRENKFTGVFLDDVSLVAGIPATNLLKLVKGKPVEITGTYAHPDLVPHIASWASPKFAIRVSKIVNAALVREYLDTIDNKNVEIKDLKQFLEQAEAKRDEAEERRQREAVEAEERRQAEIKRREEADRRREEAEARIQQLILDSKREIVEQTKQSEQRLANHMSRVDTAIDHVHEAVVEVHAVLDEIPPAAVPTNPQKKHIFGIVSIGDDKYITVDCIVKRCDEQL